MIDFRDDVFYTKTNEWAKRFGDVVRAGIDDYSQASLGDVVHIEAAESGTRVEAGKSFGAIEATKSVTEINAPVSGTITRVNDEVMKAPGLINLAPFDEGWIAEIKPDNFSDLDLLMNAAAYKKFIAQ
ncbi:MAG: glycine cleavage system protein H [Synergistaceae bacterium]|nr:glycine cleavage system protein H [Synergistaceae bacterium]